MKLDLTKLKNGIIRAKPESNEDLFDLYKIIEKGDKVKGEIWRKIKIGGEDSTKSIKKRYFAEIEVEKKELIKD